MRVFLSPFLGAFKLNPLFAAYSFSVIVSAVCQALVGSVIS